jgi:hypothetical protein
VRYETSASVPIDFSCLASNNTGDSLELMPQMRWGLCSGFPDVELKVLV